MQAKTLEEKYQQVRSALIAIVGVSDIKKMHKIMLFFEENLERLSGADKENVEAAILGLKALIDTHE